MNEPTQQAILRSVQAFQRAQRLHAEQKLAEAAEQYRQALAGQPSNLKILGEYARLAEDARNWSGAERLYRRILDVKPDSRVEGHLAMALLRQGRYADAEPWFRLHVQHFPRDLRGLHALGTVLAQKGDWAGSIRCGEDAYALSPEVRHLDLILNGCYHRGDRARLERFLAEGLERFPDSREVRSIAFLHRAMARDYANAFDHLQDYRWRNQPGRREDAGVPGEWWDGQPFEGTLLVGAEQGLGEEIIASSMFEDLLRIGQRALIECDERLIPVFRRSFPPLLDFVPRDSGRLQAAFDAGGVFRKALALDLARFFRRDAARFPARAAWLVPDAEKVAGLRARYRACWPGQRIAGISWRSRHVLEGRASKSLAPPDLATLLDTPGIAWMNLQYGDVSDEFARLVALGAAAPNVDPAIDTTRDIDGFFAQVAALDFVVSISNTAAHVAGAVGIPCHVLLPKTWPILWYWGYEGAATPWYPSLRLWRSPKDDDWQILATTVRAALASGGNAP